MRPAMPPVLLRLAETAPVLAHCCTTARYSYWRRYSPSRSALTSSSGSSSYSMAMEPAMPPVLTSPLTAPLLVQAEVLPSVILSMFPCEPSEMTEAGSLAAEMAASTVLDTSLNLLLMSRRSSATVSTEPEALLFRSFRRLPKPVMAARGSCGSERASFR